jgi:hypothetical protein
MKTEAPIATSEITNSCTCTFYNEETDEFFPTDYCYGDCWEDSVGFFAEVTKEFRESNETGWWRVENLRLWNGEVGGLFHADKVQDLLGGMTVRGEWTMNYRVFADRIEYSLAHHDAPTGSATVLWPVSEDNRQDWGLF